MEQLVAKFPEFGFKFVCDKKYVIQILPINPSKKILHIELISGELQLFTTNITAFKYPLEHIPIEKFFNDYLSKGKFQILYEKEYFFMNIDRNGNNIVKITFSIATLLPQDEYWKEDIVLKLLIV